MPGLALRCGVTSRMPAGACGDCGWLCAVCDGGEVWAPSVWLLRVGWRRYGLISIYEVPGGGDE